MEKNRSIFIWQGGFEGGAERITLDVARYLVAQGKSVVLGVYMPKATEFIPQISYAHLTWVPTSFRPFVASLLWRVRDAAKFKAVYTHKIGLWKTKQSVLFVHEAADLKKFQQNIPFWQKPAALLWRWLYTHLTLKQADYVLAATHAAALYMQHSHIAAARIKASTSWYNEHEFTFSKRDVSRPYRIVFIGNYADSRKQFSVIKTHFYKNPDFIIDVVGGLQTASEANCTFHGYQTPSRVAELLAQGHIFILPSMQEGFSLALLEALATGIPCLVHRPATPPELNGIINLVLYDRTNEILPLAQKIIGQYATYNQSDSKLHAFASSQGLAREYKYITQAIV